jgi:hypothetical protein
MIVAIASVKGSPGVTATALALAAVWPGRVAVLEADPSGGDLAFRCRAAHGGQMHAGRSVISLAASVRAGDPDPDALLDHSQHLSCGVDVVQGLTSTGQADGLGTLWPHLQLACQASTADVIVDLGRLDPRSPTLSLARGADHLMLVATPTLASVVHLSDALPSLAGALPNLERATTVTPVLVGPDASARRDRDDLDDIMRRIPITLAGLRPAASIPYDLDALQRLERGDRVSGRLGRTLLIRAARRLAHDTGDFHQRVPA